ncbi:MAG: competence/damage-inducible protein A [Syntrophomonas sp.]
MKKAYVISTGTELLLGTTIDSNSVFLSEKLTEIGIKVIGKSTVGDNRTHIYNAFELGMRSADLIISSGGLGPTEDDLTKEVACEVAGSKMELLAEEATRLREFFSARKRAMPERNLKQAMFPPEAIILKNDMGTAPGMYLNKNGKIVILLPGPPREMKNMYLQEVEQRLKDDFNIEENPVVRKTVKVLGPGESQVDEMLADLFKDPRGYSLALLAMDGEIHIKITAEGKNINESQKILEEISKQVEERMGKCIFAYDNETLNSTVAHLLVEKNMTLALAESCTGGLLAKMITDLPGSSGYFWGSVTSYSNEAKQMFLNVNENTLKKYGAVSETTAREMAIGILKKSGVDLALAITGIAGPDGGNDEKPVGLVYIALAYNDECRVKEMRFVGGREAVRILAAKTALDLLRRYLAGGTDK